MAKTAKDRAFDAMLSALQDAEIYLALELADDPDAILIRDTLKSVRAAIRKAEKAEGRTNV